MVPERVRACNRALVADPIVVLAGTELEMGCEVWADAVSVALGVGVCLTSSLPGAGAGTEVGGGTRPPERKDGHKERSSGSEAEEGERCERIAAACTSAKSKLAPHGQPPGAKRGIDRRARRTGFGKRWKKEDARKQEIKKKKAHLEQLHLLVFAQHKLGGFSPLGCVLPTMLDQTGGMSIYLEGGLNLAMAVMPCEWT